ncbi:hypothetical protein [Streptomyces bacillaris]|uniref:hypothetical protein n=1 Tax=Streptomyces bacillaris TaxID=68179 RepID=UPI003631EE78
MRAQYAETTLHTKSSRGEIAWRDIVWAYLARAIAETDPARLRAALAPVAATTDSWIAALDHRISSEPPSPDTAATGREAEPPAPAAEAVTGTQHPASETTSSFRLEHRRPGETTWQRNTPGIGPAWSWADPKTATQRLAEARDRWPDYEHQLIETTKTVTEKPVDA